MMNRMAQLRAGAIAACVAAVALAATAQAQPFPSKSIQLIVGYAPGGSVDAVARILSDRLAKRLGQPVVVMNRPGGGTVIASQALAKAAPDGHTIMLADIAHGANPALNRKLPYDTQKAFEPVVLVATFPTVLAVHPSLAVKDLQGFVALLKQKPDTVFYSTSGIGSMNHLASELFKRETATRMTAVHHQSGGQAITAVLGGHVQVMMATVPPLAGNVDKLTLLAVSAPQRLTAIPNVPTFSEAGMPQFRMQLWQGFIVPAGTPADAVKRLNTEINAVLADPEVRDRIVQLGGSPQGGTTDAFGKFIDADIATWAQVITPDMLPQ